MRTVAYRLMLVMVFTLPWENVVDLPVEGRVSKVVGLLVALAWVLAVLTSRRLREPGPVHILALLFVLWNTFSLIWTVDGPATQERVITYVQLLGLMFVVWDTVTSRAQVRQVLLAYLAGSYVTVIALLGGYALLGEGAEVNGRVTVGSFHPNDVGMVLALGVPVACYLISTAPRDRWRWAFAVAAGLYVPLAGFAILVTGSRASLGAMAPGLAYGGYLVARHHKGAAIGVLTTVGLLTMAALPFLPPRVLARFAGTESAIQGGDERAEVWAEAVRLFADNPVFGIGGGAFRSAAVGVNKVGHNFVLALLAEVGLIGFGLFAAMLTLAVLSIRRSTPVLRGLWLSLFSAWMFAALLHNWEYRKQTWLFIALVVVCGALRSGHEDEDAERELVEADRPGP